jgi:hypothetical protein
MKASKRFMTLFGLFIVVSTFMLFSAAMAAQISNSPAQAPGATLQPSIKFTEISVNFKTTNVVVAYEPPPATMRLVCKFSDISPNPKSTHSVDFYINNNKVFDKDKDFDHAQFKGDTALMDIPIPAEGTYTFKCVVDSKSISLTFAVTKFSYVTCVPSITIHLKPYKSELMNDLNGSKSGDTGMVLDVTFQDNIVEDKSFSLTWSGIASGDLVACSYGSAVTYKVACKYAKKISQDKYQCSQ